MLGVKRTLKENIHFRNSLNFRQTQVYLKRPTNMLAYSSLCNCRVGAAFSAVNLIAMPCGCTKSVSHQWGWMNLNPQDSNLQMGYSPNLWGEIQLFKGMLRVQEPLPPIPTAVIETEFVHHQPARLQGCKALTHNAGSCGGRWRGIVEISNLEDHLHVDLRNFPSRGKFFFFFNEEMTPKTLGRPRKH